MRAAKLMALYSKRKSLNFELTVLIAKIREEPDTKVKLTLYGYTYAITADLHKIASEIDALLKEN